ncbi:unnamed protein product [Schistosoma margrebowiei]|uniref:Protein sleepless n=1 Tax=Schistosoma margrebowiei TaxID=48269 RepID=A0AA84ZAK3_9TREM|nr:unnamed protein product [Schistosoma margrebowiei]
MTHYFVSHLPLGVIVVFLCVLQQESVYGIQCVVCNSYLDGQLCEPWDQFTFITNCSKYPGIDASKPISCRKIDQVVEHERRVVRQCSNVIDNLGCIDRVGTNDVRIRYCHCTEDLCNSITAVKPQSFYYLSSLSALTFSFIRLLIYT